MIRKCLAVLSVMLLLAALKAPVAKATSDYDGVYRTTGELKTSVYVAPIPVNTQCPALDLSATWASAIIDTNNWNPGMAASASSYSQALQDALDHGAWAVGEVSSPIQGYTYITVVWTTSHASLIWGTQDTHLSSSSMLYSVSIAENSSCKPDIQANTVGDGVSSSTVANFLVAGDVDLNYPAGYEGTPINQTYTPPAPTYVAMGDSFSSGEGDPPFQDSDGCDRSQRAYPHWLAGDTDLNLGTLGFVACSGATTSNVTTSGQNGEAPQVDALSLDTDTVTITIGGNDAGFQEYALGCTVNCSQGTPTYNAIMSSINAPAFKANLETTYGAILQDAPNAQIYVVDYPYMSKDYTSTDITTRCGNFNLLGTRDVQVALNSAIESAVGEVGGSRLHYVNSNTSGSPFAGKYLCSEEADSDFGQTTLHPNVQGQQAYATVVKNYIQAH